MRPQHLVQAVMSSAGNDGTPHLSDICTYGVVHARGCSLRVSCSLSCMVFFICKPPLTKRGEYP